MSCTDLLSLKCPFVRQAHKATEEIEIFSRVLRGKTRKRQSSPDLLNLTARMLQDLLLQLLDLYWQYLANLKKR